LVIYKDYTEMHGQQNIKITVGHSLLPEYHSASVNPRSVLFTVRSYEMYTLPCVDILY